MSFNFPIVLQVLPKLKSGGVERGALEIARALLKKNYPAYVCSAGGAMVDTLEQMGAKHITMPVDSKNPFIILLNVLRLKKIIIDNNIDIVHARSRAPAWSCYFACKLTGAKFLTTFHGTYSAKSWFKRLYNSVMLKGENVIVISKFIYSHVLKIYKTLPEKLIIINRGVDLDYFALNHITEQRLSSLKQSMRLSDNLIKSKKIILMPARFTRWKGHLYLLEALKYISDEKFICLMVGANDKSHEDYLKEIKITISKYNLENKVIVKSEVSDMPALYALSHLVVSTSLKPEAFGRTIIEAQSMGKIIIATEEGGASEESIIDKVTGFHIPKNNAREASKVILNALRLPQEEYNKISLKALDNVKRNFNLNLMCDKTLQVYNSLFVKSK